MISFSSSALKLTVPVAHRAPAHSARGDAVFLFRRTPEQRPASRLPDSLQTLHALANVFGALVGLPALRVGGSAGKASPARIQIAVVRLPATRFFEASAYARPPRPRFVEPPLAQTRPTTLVKQSGPSPAPPQRSSTPIMKEQHALPKKGAYHYTKPTGVCAPPKRPVPQQAPEETAVQAEPPAPPQMPPDEAAAYLAALNQQPEQVDPAAYAAALQQQGLMPAAAGSHGYHAMQHEMEAQSCRGERDRYHQASQLYADQARETRDHLQRYAGVPEYAHWCAQQAQEATSLDRKAGDCTADAMAFDEKAAQHAAEAARYRSLAAQATAGAPEQPLAVAQG